MRHPRIAKLATAAVTAAVAALPAIVFSSAPASAAAQCVFTPKPPARVVVGQSVVGMTTRLTANNPECTANFDASTQLVHGTDSFFLMWDNRDPDVQSVYAYEIVPGTYRTTANDCSAYDASYNQYSCSLRNASTVIKFAGRTSLAVRRSGATVSFVVHSKRYSAFNGFIGAAAPVAIQRFGNGAWHTLATRNTSRTAGATWSYRHAGQARYRAVSATTAAAFSSTSAVVTK